jgi:hypothetical protein
MDANGICMDPNKVNQVINWKVPTNRDLLWGSIGSVGYLANDIHILSVSAYGHHICHYWRHSAIPMDKN